MKLKRRYHKVLWGIQNRLHGLAFDRRERHRIKSLTRLEPLDTFAAGIRRAFRA